MFESPPQHDEKAEKACERKPGERDGANDSRAGDDATGRWDVRHRGDQRCSIRTASAASAAGRCPSGSSTASKRIRACGRFRNLCTAGLGSRPSVPVRPVHPLNPSARQHTHRSVAMLAALLLAPLRAQSSTFLPSRKANAGSGFWIGHEVATACPRYAGASPCRSNVTQHRVECGPQPFIHLSNRENLQINSLRQTAILKAHRCTAPYLGRMKILSLSRIQTEC